MGDPAAPTGGGGLLKFSKPGLFLADPPFGHVWATLCHSEVNIAQNWSILVPVLAQGRDNDTQYKL